MRGYLLRRIAAAIAVLWAVYTVTFIVLTLLPGDPVSAMAAGGLEGSPVTAEEIARLKHEYGFDRPVLVQYLEYLGHAVRGDFGASVATGQPVTQMIADALPQTLALTAVALVIAIVGGVGLAIVAETTRLPWLRATLLSLPPIGVALPTFWVGLILVQLLSFRVHLFPAFGNSTAASVVLPAITLAIPAGAMIAAVFAKSLGVAARSAYADTARAKGVGRWTVGARHAAPNAALPALTVFGLLLGNMIAGAVVVETVFARNGIGRITVSAVSMQDIPVVQGVVLLGAVVFVSVNLALDLVYPWLDPRVVTAHTRERSLV